MFKQKHILPAILTLAVIFIIVGYFAGWFSKWIPGFAYNTNGSTNGNTRSYQVGGRIGGSMGVGSGFGVGTDTGVGAVTGPATSPITTGVINPLVINSNTCQAILNRVFAISQIIKSGGNIENYRAEMSNLYSRYTSACGTLPGDATAKKNWARSMCNQGCLNRGYDYSFCGDFCSMW